MSMKFEDIEIEDYNVKVTDIQFSTNEIVGDKTYPTEESSYVTYTKGYELRMQVSFEYDSLTGERREGGIGCSLNTGSDLEDISNVVVKYALDPGTSAMSSNVETQYHADEVTVVDIDELTAEDINDLAVEWAEYQAKSLILEEYAQMQQKSLLSKLNTLEGIVRADTNTGLDIVDLNVNTIYPEFDI